MPVIKSARKRVKVAAKANARNARVKRLMRDSLKRFSASLAGGKPEEIAKAHQAAASALDIAAKKNIIHKNKAARKKSQIAARAKAAGAKQTAAPAAKPAAKPAKKTSAKKPTAAKKPAAKKTAKKAPSKK